MHLLRSRSENNLIQEINISSGLETNTFYPLSHLPYPLPEPVDHKMGCCGLQIRAYKAHGKEEASGGLQMVISK